MWPWPPAANTGGEIRGQVIKVRTYPPIVKS
jgi:hypothetical protein